MEAAAAYILEKHIPPSLKNIKRLLEQQADKTAQQGSSAQEQSPAIGEESQSFIRSGDYFLNP